MVYLLWHSRGNKLLNIKTTRPSDKLDFKKLGPYKILKKIGEVNYKLELPENIRLHLIFHVLLLEKALVDENTRETIIDEIIVEAEEEEYEVEDIIATRPGEEEHEYLVK